MIHWQPSQCYPKTVNEERKVQDVDLIFQYQIPTLLDGNLPQTNKGDKLQELEFNSSGYFEYVKQTSTLDHKVKAKAEDDVQRQGREKNLLSD